MAVADCTITIRSIELHTTLAVARVDMGASMHIEAVVGTSLVLLQIRLVLLPIIVENSKWLFGILYGV